MTKKVIGILLVLTVNPVFGKLTNQKSMQSELTCMANNILHEAGGESELGQKAVAAVTMNRVLSSKFPNTVCAVVYQKGQFSWVGKKKSRKIPGAIIKIAEMYINSYNKSLDITHGSTYFNSSKRSNWKNPKSIKIGGHQFYRDTSPIVYSRAPTGERIAYDP